jgi:pimeloyl-ACP methyl ester carboxylesterase
MVTHFKTSLALTALPLALAPLWVPPVPPAQPPAGPGGRAYSHAGVTWSRLGSGAGEVYLFEPIDPRPARAPVVVFAHGWAGMSPNYYGAWIEHLVRRGAIVIFPRYQADLRTPVAEFTGNALSAVRVALDELKASGHVTPDERGLAFVGHSMGGLVAANLSVRAARGELPPPLALMAVMPGKTWPQGSPIAFPLEDLEALPAHVLLLAVVGEDDELVRDVDARRIYRESTAVPRANKDYVRMFSDDFGTPSLLADHRAPTAPAELVDSGTQDLRLGPRRGRLTSRRVPMGTDALDYYGTWKLFDGLLDAVYRGVNREFALGDTPEQRFMGEWSDGTPVRELMVREP